MSDKQNSRIAGNIKGPDIPIEEATAESVSKAIFEREFGWLKRELEGVNKILATLIIILGVGFITLLLMVTQMLIESWRFKSAIDQSLIQSLYKQDEILKDGFKSINKQKEILQEIKQSLASSEAQKQ